MSDEFAVPHKCPSCGSLVVRRSKRRRADHRILLRKPYRCRQCRRRFWAVSTRTWSWAVAALLLAAAAWSGMLAWRMYDDIGEAAAQGHELERAARFGASPK